MLGILGGMLGAFFISVNTHMGKVRKLLLPKQWMKPLETVFWCVLTSSVFFFLTHLTLTQNWCIKVEGDLKPEHYLGWCNSGYEDPMASILWASEGGIIRNIMDNRINLSLTQIFLVFAGWYLFTIITYGTNIPAGLFLPGMIIGCALGKVYAEFMYKIKFIGDEEFEDSQKVFVVLGVGAVMAGYTRLTYTLAIIVMETSQVISLFIPTAFTILVSNVVGYFFTRSLYERAIRAKQQPILVESVPKSQKYVIADQIMSSHCVTLKSVDTVGNIYDALKTGHHAFPIMNKNNNVSGVIPRNFIIVLLVNRAFYRMGKLSSVGVVGGLNTSKVTDEEDGIREERVDTNV